jgi:mRNA interferase YafQ
MCKITQTGRFRKDLKQMKKRGKDQEKLFYIVELLAHKGHLPTEFRPHKLSGEWGKVWECHIEPDWLVIYTITDKEILLIRTGTHADLFN